MLQAGRLAAPCDKRNLISVPRNQKPQRRLGEKSEDYPMQHVRKTIEELRRYIAQCEARVELEEVDSLLAVALEEVRRKLQQRENEQLRQRT